MAQYTQEQYNQDLSASWKKHVATRLRTELPDIPSDATDDDVLGYVRDTEIPQDASSDDVNKFFYDKYSSDWEPPKPPKPSLGEMALGVGKGLGQGIALFGGASKIGKIAAKAAKAPIAGPVGQLVAAAPSALELGGAAIAGKKMEEEQANFPRLTPEHLRQVNKQLIEKGVSPELRQMLIHRYTLNLTRGYDAAQSSLANDIIETGKEGVHKSAEAAANAIFLPVGASALEKFIGATMAKSTATRAVAPIVSGAAGGAVLGAGFGGVTGGVSAGAQAQAGEMHPAEEGKPGPPTPPGAPLEEAISGALHGAVDGLKWGASIGGALGTVGSILGATIPWAAKLAARGADRKAELAPKLDIGESVYPELAPEKGAAGVPLGVAQPVGAPLAPTGGLAHEATPPGLAGTGVEPTSPQFVPPAKAVAAPEGLERTPTPSRAARVPVANTDVQKVATDYSQKAGIEREPSKYEPLDTEKGRAIAKEYEVLPKTPASPGEATAAKRAYSALNQEVAQQFKAIQDAGFKIEFTKEDPYKNSAEMMRDVAENKRLKVFESGEQPHPFMTKEQNDMFRAVHDFFGHAAEGFEFGPRGEDNAWRAHAKMFSNEAIPALTTETRGQNSWVNFAQGHEEMSQKDRPFAEQKAGLLPEWTYKEALHPEGASFTTPEVPGVKGLERTPVPSKPGPTLAEPSAAFSKLRHEDVTLPTEPVERSYRTIQQMGEPVESHSNTTRKIAGARVEITPHSNGDRLVIRSLEGAEHGKAQSAAALKEVLSQADAAGAPVEVQASEYVGKRGGTIPAEKVAAWYEKQGFKRVPGTGDAITLMHTPPATDALSTKQLGELALYHLGDTDEARLNSFMDRVEGLSKEKVQEATGNVTEGQQIAKGSWADELGSKLDGAAKLAAERLNAKRGRLTAGIDPTDFSDLVIVGAAKMYRLGLTRFKPWAEEMVRDYGEPIQAHLKELFARTQKFMKDRIERANVSFSRAKTLMTMAKQGEAGANWYNETKNWTDENFGPDSDMMLRFLSATSAGMSTDANVSLAMRAYAQWKLGLPFDNYLGVHKNMLESAVRDEPFGDRKVQSILAALRGDENAVVIDRRVMRTLGFKMAGKSKTGEGILGAQGSLTNKQYELFEGVIRDLAKQSDMSPREFQAALWAANKIEEAQSAKTPREMAYVGSFRPYEQIVQGKLEKLTPAEWVSRNRVTVEQMAAANEGVNATRAGEGWTYNPHNFNAYTGKKGIVVTLASAKIPTKELTGSTVIDFGNRFKRLVASFYGTTIGTFNLDKYEKGMSSIDFNIVMPESMRDRAIELGKARRQHSLWDLSKGEEISTGFKGKSYEPPKKGAAAFWAQEIKNLDQLMARLDIPSRSMHQSDMFNATSDRVPSSLDYWGIEAEQVMPKAIREQFENAKTGEELSGLVQKYSPELAGRFKDAKLSASREELGSAADDLQQYYAKKNGIAMPEPDKQAGDQIPNGSGLNRGTLEAMARTPHRWLTYAAEALGKSEGDIRQMVDDGEMKPMSEASMLNKVEIHKDGLVWEYTDPTPPSYNIMKLVGRLGGKMGPATLAKLEGKEVLSGHDVLANYKSQAGFLALGTSQYKAVEGLLKKNLTNKIEDSMVRQGGSFVDNLNAFRNQRHMGTSLWIGQDGRVIRVHFHLRNAARVSDDLKLQNPVQYEGPEHSDQQTILNYGFVRVQMHENMLAVDATAPLSEGQKRVLRELMRKSTTGDREFRGRVVNPNGEHRSFTQSYHEFVDASENPKRITVKG